MEKFYGNGNFLFLFQEQEVGERNEKAFSDDCFCELGRREEFFFV